MVSLKDRIAQGVSLLFHPLLIPLLGLFILFQLNTYISYSLTIEARRFIMGMVFVNTMLAPLLSVLILKRTGYISSLTLLDRSERVFPLLLTAIMFFFTYYMLRQLTLPSLLYFYFMGATLLVLLVLLISFFWKISIHMVSLGGFTGFLIVTSLMLQLDISWLIALAFLVSGVTASARLQLRAHVPAEVYAGYLLGLAGMLLLFLYLRA